MCDIVVVVGGPAEGVVRYVGWHEVFTREDGSEAVKFPPPSVWKSIRDPETNMLWLKIVKSTRRPATMER